MIIVIVQKFAVQTATICRLAPLFADLLHYLPTQSTICRHRPLFADTVHYLPTKRSLICRHVPNAPTFASLRNVSFSLSGHPTPTPPPTVGAPSRSASQAARPRFLPARQPAAPAREIRNGILFADKRFNICRHSILFADKRFIICRHSILFADKGSLRNG